MNIKEMENKSIKELWEDLENEFNFISHDFSQTSFESFSKELDNFSKDDLNKRIILLQLMREFLSQVRSNKLDFDWRFIYEKLFFSMPEITPNVLFKPLISDKKRKFSLNLTQEIKNKINKKTEGN